MSLHTDTLTRRPALTVIPAPTRGNVQQATIVVPCYNEAERLDLDAFRAHLAQNADIDFLFVNDGSKDATLDVLEELRTEAPDRVRVLDLNRNSGKAEAVRQGLLVAINRDAGLVGYWDADLATPLDAIDDFVRVMRKFSETQVVYGARRMMLGHRIERTLGRRMVSRVCATLARQAVRLPIGDTQCGAKLLRSSPALREALATPFTAGWLFDVELFARLSANLEDRSRAFYEQPLAEWDEVAGSKVSTRAIVRSGFQMVRLIAEARFGLPVAAPVETATPVTAHFVTETATATAAMAKAA